MIVDYTIIIVLCGASIMGLTSGLLGSFALLRQQSLLGDAIAHASLPGIVGMFLLTQTTSTSVLLLGGACAGIIGVMFMHILMCMTRLKKDAILGIILSVFFGIGLVLLTIVQKQPFSHQSILNKFLFGSASTLLLADVYLMALLACVVLCCLVLYWKQFVFIIFDRQSAGAMGYAVSVYECWLNCLLVISIIIGLQTVGVVLMSTMLIAPAAAARQWVMQVTHMVLLSGFFGVLAALIGVCISSYIVSIPTGPTIVVVESIIVCISLVCAPQRGLFWQFIRIRDNT